MQPNFKEYDLYCITKAFYHALSNNDETNIQARLLNKSESKCGNANNVSAIFETLFQPHFFVMLMVAVIFELGFSSCVGWML